MAEPQFGQFGEVEPGNRTDGAIGRPSVGRVAEQPKEVVAADQGQWLALGLRLSRGGESAGGHEHATLSAAAGHHAVEFAD